MPSTETFVQRTIRLSPADMQNIDEIVKTGVASNASEAIRVSLALTQRFLLNPAEALTAATRTPEERSVAVVDTAKETVAGKAVEKDDTARAWRFFGEDSMMLELREWRNRKSVSLIIESTIASAGEGIRVSLNPTLWRQFLATAAEARILRP
jgi:Arc/MetJ-type ribon-helix-helix transcriptional regulator